MARNGVHTGGRTKAEYYKVWDKETGVYKGVWRIGARQRKMPSLFRYERVSPEKEEEYNKHDKTYLIRVTAKRENKKYDYGFSIHENWLDDNSINELINFLLIQ